MSSRQRILVDCDPGIDDAFALMCALRFADLAAVTTVSGNVSIDNTTRNARYLLDMTSRFIAVRAVRCSLRPWPPTTSTVPRA